MLKESIQIHKYGGTSMADAACIKNVANRIVASKRQGHHVIAVVSAAAGVTDNLLKLAKEITKYPSKRELDMMLATGEQVSMALLAMAIHNLGESAVSLTSQQAGIFTDGNYNEAKVESIEKNVLLEALKREGIVILPGFQGVTKDLQITTLGRGGSDTSAVAVATALGVGRVYIFTDVDGVYTADPRIESNAKKIHEITYDEMLELAGSGAKVLHVRSVELAAKNYIDIHLKSSFTDIDGTVIKEASEDMEEMVVRGVAHSLKKAKITLCDIEGKGHYLSYIFQTIAEYKINIDIVTQTQNQDDKITIAFIVDEDQYDKTLSICHGIKADIGHGEIVGNKNVAKISIVGIGIKSSYGVAAKVFSILSENDIEIDMVSTSDINISCIIDEQDFEKAVCVLHEALID